MRKQLFFWELAGFLFTAAVGALLHFVYQWSGSSTLAAAFSAVNESTWEHMKLLFFPYVFVLRGPGDRPGTAVPQFSGGPGRQHPGGLILIPVLFYTYTGVLGRDVMWADVAVFILAALGRSPWTGGCCAGAGGAADGSRCWGCWCCGAWPFCSCTAPSIPALACGGTR
mgnify:CR=1 FL=1